MADLKALAKVEGKSEGGAPVVLFMCVHNAGRSQMALGWFTHMAAGRALAWSGGSEPTSEVNPAAIEAMSEVGIDISGEFPKPWTDEIVQAADVVITMGCGDACPIFPGKRYEDWGLEDPAGKAVADVRPVRDEIGRRVAALLEQLNVPVPSTGVDPSAASAGATKAASSTEG
jgi:arsenate reductase (thioredoxin)